MTTTVGRPATKPRHEPGPDCPSDDRPSRVVSVVTAVHEAYAAYLTDAHASLDAQHLPPGWRWEWLVQCDGRGDLPTELAADPRVHLDANRRTGPAATRTMALSRATGGLVRALDADDQLLPGALARDIDLLTARPDLGWAVSPGLDLTPDGQVAAAPHTDPEPGELPRGWFVDAWAATGWTHLPVLPSTICIRTQLLVALGGWMALPTSEDTGLLAAASAVSPGWLHREPAILYRRHDGQLSGTRGHLDPAQAELRRRLVVARARALGAGLPGAPTATATAADRAVRRGRLSAAT